MRTVALLVDKPYSQSTRNIRAKDNAIERVTYFNYFLNGTKMWNSLGAMFALGGMGKSVGRMVILVSKTCTSETMWQRMKGLVGPRFVGVPNEMKVPTGSANGKTYLESGDSPKEWDVEAVHRCSASARCQAVSVCANECCNITI